MPSDDTTTPPQGSPVNPSPTTKRTRAKPAPKTTVAKTAPAEVLPPPVADDVIDEVVSTLNGWQRVAGFAFARQVGQLLIDKFYAGDVSAWRSRQEKDASFRKLKQRADEGALQISAPSLYRSVALVELEDRIGAVDKVHLTMTHVREVFGLPAEQQAKLLTAAAEKGWSIQDMEKAAGKVRKKEGDGRGRPALPTFVKSISALARIIAQDDGDPDPFGDMDALDQITEEQAQALWQTVTGVKLKCEEIQKKLAVKVPGFGVVGE